MVYGVTEKKYNKDKLHGGRVSPRFKQFMLRAAETDGRCLAAATRKACQEWAEKVLHEKYEGYKVIHGPFGKMDKLAIEEAKKAQAEKYEKYYKEKRKRVIKNKRW